MTGATDERERQLIEAAEWLLRCQEEHGEALDHADLMVWGVWSQDSGNLKAVHEVQAFTRDLEIWRRVSALDTESVVGPSRAYRMQSSRPNADTSARVGSEGKSRVAERDAQSPSAGRCTGARILRQS